MGSCLDLGIPGTSLQGGGVGCRARPAQSNGKESVGTRQRLGRQDEGQRETHSGRDTGGSAANRVRRLPVHSYNIVNK